MKKFFAILLGIVDVFCVGLIFYLMLSNLSGTPAQIFLPILPPTLVAFLAAALIGALTGRNLPPNPRRKPRASAAATPDPSVTSLPFFSPPAAQKQRGVIFPLWKGGPHETSLSHIPLRLDTGLLLDGLLHFAFLFQRISAGPRILQHPDRPAAWLVRPFGPPCCNPLWGPGRTT